MAVAVAVAVVAQAVAVARVEAAAWTMGAAEAVLEAADEAIMEAAVGSARSVVMATTVQVVRVPVPGALCRLVSKVR